MIDPYVIEVCRLGQGADCCRYLTMDGVTGNWECANGTEIGKIIDARVEAGSITAVSINCEGKVL